MPTIDDAIREIATAVLAKIPMDGEAEQKLYHNLRNIVPFILNHEHSQWIGTEQEAGRQESWRVQVMNSDGSIEWHKITNSQDQLPPNAIADSLINLQAVAGVDRPVHYIQSTLGGIRVAMIAILEGKTDCAAADAVHRQWKVDNPSRQEEEVLGEWGELDREMMLKDMFTPNTIRMMLIDDETLLPQFPNIEEGGVIQAMDVQLGATPPAWDEFIQNVEIDFPQTYNETKLMYQAWRQQRHTHRESQ